MLIGLSGYAGAGKDTAAAYLAMRHGFEQRAFADKLRDLALAADPTIDGPGQRLKTLVGNDGWDVAKREYSQIRVFLQNLGNGARIIFGENFWIDQVLPMRYGAARRSCYSYKNIVVSDVRYQNEVKRIHDLGGKVVLIDRPGIGPVNDHITEKRLYGIDFHISNVTGQPSLMTEQLTTYLFEGKN